MKRGAKATIFIASMALTIGSLMAIAGPRRHWHHGMYGHGYCANGAYYQHHGNCAQWNNCGSDSLKTR